MSKRSNCSSEYVIGESAEVTSILDFCCYDEFSETIGETKAVAQVSYTYKEEGKDENTIKDQEFKGDVARILEYLFSELEKCGKYNKEYEKKLREAKEEVERGNKYCSSLKEQVSNIKKELESKCERTSKLLESNRLLEENNKDLLHKLRMGDANIKDLSDRIDDLESKIRSLEMSKREAQVIANNLEGSNSKLKKVVCAIIEEL